MEINDEIVKCVSVDMYNENIKRDIVQLLKDIQDREEYNIIILSIITAELPHGWDYTGGRTYEAIIVTYYTGRSKIR